MTATANYASVHKPLLLRSKSSAERKAIVHPNSPVRMSNAPTTNRDQEAAAFHY